jgi:hypothetical protein
VAGEFLTLVKAFIALHPERVIRTVPFLGPSRYLIGTAPGIFDYSPLGAHRREGYLNTGFASGLTTHLSVTFGAGLIADLAEAATPIVASAITGAEVGSVEPGLGTLIGAGVGLTIGVISATPPGQAAEREVRKRVKAGLDTEVAGFNSLVHQLQRLGEGVLGGRTRPPAFPGQPQAWGLPS